MPKHPSLCRTFRITLYLLGHDKTIHYVLQEFEVEDTAIIHEQGDTAVRLIELYSLRWLEGFVCGRHCIMWLGRVRVVECGRLENWFGIVVYRAQPHDI